MSELDKGRAELWELIVNQLNNSVPNETTRSEILTAQYQKLLDLPTEYTVVIRLSEPKDIWKMISLIDAFYPASTENEKTILLQGLAYRVFMAGIDRYNNEIMKALNSNNNKNENQHTEHTGGQIDEGPQGP
jgi:hypothetical protein